MQALMQWEWVLKLFLAALLGGTIGWNRKHYGKQAGTRTFSLIAMASTLFTLLSINGFASGDPARMASSILTGIGFIGAGIIWHNKDSTIGITTAAGLWVSTAIGIAVALDYWIVALLATAFTILILELKLIFKKL